MQASTDYNFRFSYTLSGIAGIYLILLTALYWGPFSAMVKWWSRDDYSYCYLIPFIVLYLLWDKRLQWLETPAQPSWAGIAPFVLGLFCYWLGELSGTYYIQYVSFWFILIGVCLVHMGWARVKAIFFPLALILTMFPLPNFFNYRINLELKIISSRIGVWMMQLFGMSAFREGNIIDIGFTQLQVVDACSGLRYLFPLIVLGILLAYFYQASLWKKVLVVFSTVPLTIVTNSLRIALTGVFSEIRGVEAAEGFFHDFEGWVIFMVSTGVLILEMMCLKYIFPEKKQILKPKTLSRHQEKGNNSAHAVSFKQIQWVAISVPLLLTFLLTRGIDFREAVPLGRSFQTFPMHIAEWNGTVQKMTADVIEELDFTDYILADFIDEKGQVINFYVAYYESQRKGESIHSPASCLRGGGWNFKQSGKHILTLKNGDKFIVNKAIIEKTPYTEIAYYWFPSRGRILTDAYQMKWYNFWDALTRQRTDGALVRLITRINKEENIDAAEQRITAFLQEIVPVLQKYLPR